MNTLVMRKKLANPIGLKTAKCRRTGFKVMGGIGCVL